MLDWIFRWFSKKDSKTVPVSTTETIDGTEFARLATNGTTMFDEMEGIVLFHRTFGEGRIVRIQERNRNMPLITARFYVDYEERQFNLKAFQDGYFPGVEIGALLLKRLRNCPPRLFVDDTPRRREEAGYALPVVSISSGRSKNHVPRRNGHRITHCWCCKRDGLDSNFDAICPECGGIICPHCGACLCEWEGIDFWY